MLILQLTDAPPGTTSWFPARWPRLVMGTGWGGGRKDTRLPPQPQHQEHCTCCAHHGMWWVFPGMKHRLRPPVPPIHNHIQATKEEAVGQAQTSPAIKVIKVIDQSQPPCDGPQKILIIPPATEMGFFPIPVFVDLSQGQVGIRQLPTRNR